MGAVGMALWPPRSEVIFLATGHLNACTAVAIISPEAAILAHIPPLPYGTTAAHLAQTPNLAVVNADRLLTEMARLYQRHQELFNPSQTIVICGVVDTPNQPRGYAMEAVLLRIRQYMATVFRFPTQSIQWQSYPVLGPQERAAVNGPDGHVWVIIRYVPHAMPRVIVSRTEGVAQVYPRQE